MDTTHGNRETARSRREGRVIRAAVAAEPDAVAPEPDGGPPFEYAVERVGHGPLQPGHIERELNDVLNARAQASWRALAVLPQGNDDVLVVFERATDAPAAVAERLRPAQPEPRPERPSGPWPPPELLRASPTIASDSGSARDLRTPATSHPESDGRGSRRGLVVAAATASTLALATAIAVAAFDGDGTRPAASVDPERAVPAVEACTSASAAALATGPLTCSTPAGVLTIASSTRPLVLEGIELRALKARRGRETATIRARVRNSGTRPLALSFASRVVYLAVGGRRLPGSGVAGPVRVGAGAARTVELTFPLDTVARRALARTGNRVDLGVRDPSAPADAPRRGAIRLRLGR